MKIKVLLFGHLRAVTGRKEVEFESTHTTYVKDVINFLKERFPEFKEILTKLAPGESIAILVNNKIALENVELKDGDEVALIPPISGGLKLSFNQFIICLFYQKVLFQFDKLMVQQL
ncbi:MoaD/ThiS family protein [Candidatus Bathyarchaeota archaeon]|nr:MoaD/ThiS family protein [Candidatus Bathyarchaeota archaeon]